MSKKEIETKETQFVEKNNNDSHNNKSMKNNKGIFWGLLLVIIGILWLGWLFGLFNFYWLNMFKLWPLIIIWIGIKLLPIDQVWKNVSSIILLAAAVVLLFIMPAKSCHHHFWGDKFHFDIEKKFKDLKSEIDENDTEDFNIDDETITVSVDSGMVTINRESKEDGETKVKVKKIKL